MDSNYRQELVSPETGQTHVVGSPVEAARLKAKGFREPELEPPVAGEAEPVVADPPAAPKIAARTPRSSQKKTDEQQDAGTSDATP